MSHKTWISIRGIHWVDEWFHCSNSVSTRVRLRESFAEQHTIQFLCVGSTREHIYTPFYQALLSTIPFFAYYTLVITLGLSTNTILSLQTLSAKMSSRYMLCFTAKLQNLTALQPQKGWDNGKEFDVMVIQTNFFQFILF